MWNAIVPFARFYLKSLYRGISRFSKRRSNVTVSIFRYLPVNLVRAWRKRNRTWSTYLASRDIFRSSRAPTLVRFAGAERVKCRRVRQETNRLRETSRAMVELRILSVSRDGFSRITPKRYVRGEKCTEIRNYSDVYYGCTKFRILFF